MYSATAQQLGTSVRPSAAYVVERTLDELIPEALPAQRALDLGVREDELVADVPVVGDADEASVEQELVARRVPRCGGPRSAS